MIHIPFFKYHIPALLCSCLLFAESTPQKQINTQENISLLEVNRSYKRIKMEPGVVYWNQGEKPSYQEISMFTSKKLKVIKQKNKDYGIYMEKTELGYLAKVSIFDTSKKIVYSVKVADDFHIIFGVI